MESGRIRPVALDWIYLAFPTAITVIGVGVLTGLMFENNPVFQGSMKYVIGGILTLYGLGRCMMAAMKLRRRKKDSTWMEKS